MPFVWLIDLHIRTTCIYNAIKIFTEETYFIAVQTFFLVMLYGLHLFINRAALTGKPKQQKEDDADIEELLPRTPNAPSR